MKHYSLQFTLLIVACFFPFSHTSFSQDFDKTEFCEFRDSQYKFVFLYPKSYLKTPVRYVNNRLDIVSNYGHEKEEVIVNVQELRHADACSPKEFVRFLNATKMIENNFKDLYPECKIIESGTTTISNQKAYYIISSYMDISPGIEREMNQILVQTINNNYVYTLYARTTNQNKFSELLSLFSYLQSSFWIYS